MMRKKTKMAWSVALSAAMAAGLLAGCGSNGGTESTSGSTAASSAKTESSASDTTDTSDRPTYKIATVTGPSRNLCCWLPETSRMHSLDLSA